MIFAPFIKIPQCSVAPLPSVAPKPDCAPNNVDLSTAYSEVERQSFKPLDVPKIVRPPAPPMPGTSLRQQAVSEMNRTLTAAEKIRIRNNLPAPMWRRYALYVLTDRDMECFSHTFLRHFDDFARVAYWDYAEGSGSVTRNVAATTLWWASALRQFVSEFALCFNFRVGHSIDGRPRLQTLTQRFTDGDLTQFIDFAAKFERPAPETPFWKTWKIQERLTQEEQKDFLNALQHLPVSEQYVMRVRVPHGSSQNISPMLHQIEHFLGYGGPTAAEDEQPYLYFPSLSIIDILNKIVAKEDAIRLVPTVGVLILNDFRRANYFQARLLGLNHPDLQKLNFADGYYAGEAMFSFHDIYHLTRVSKISRVERWALIRADELMCDYLKSVSSVQERKKILTIRRELVDMELYDSKSGEKFGLIFSNAHVSFTAETKQLILQKMVDEDWELHFGLNGDDLLDEEANIHAQLLAAQRAYAMPEDKHLRAQQLYQRAKECHDDYYRGKLLIIALRMLLRDIRSVKELPKDVHDLCVEMSRFGINSKLPIQQRCQLMDLEEQLAG